MTQTITLPKLTTLTTCILCDKEPQELINLGNQYLTDFLDNPDANHPKAPLQLMLCADCGLTQLHQVVDRDALFRNYHYRSGINATVRAHLKALAEDAKKRLKLISGNDIILDIGANDGTFLANFPAQWRMGFEPALNLGGDYEQIQDFFSATAYKQRPKPALVSSIAMFYDLLEPKKFAQDVAEILAPKGLWVCEMNYLGSMLENNAFDFIGHEHVAEYSLAAFERAITPAGLEVVDMSLNSLNGGSARYWVAHKGSQEKKDSVVYLREQERQILTTAAFESFRDNVKTVVWKLGSLIRSEVRKGKRVWAKGASTRGMTLLQTVELDNHWIEAISDANPLKHGKYVAGLNIPVRSNEEMRKEQPDYLLILPWGFAEAFIEQEHGYLKKGGTVVIPLPTVRTVVGIQK